MGKKKKSKQRYEEPESSSFTLGDLLRSKGIELPGAEHKEGPAENSKIEEKLKKPSEQNRNLQHQGGRVVLRLEKKGRRGKSVTLIQGLSMQDSQLKECVGVLRKTFGVGATIQGNEVVVQGDLRDRIAKWLPSIGAEDFILS